MGNALCEAPLSGRHPDCHCARRRRERRPLAKTKGEPDEDEREKAADGSGQYRRDADDEPRDTERQTRTELITEPAADQLKDRIRIGKGGKRETERGVAEAEIFLDKRRCGRDIYPVDVKDEIHQAQ